MSLLDTVSKLFSGSEGESSPIAGILHLLANQEGGTAGLVERFQNGGLGNVLASWLGPGANDPISPDQVNRVFGNQQVQALAAKLGITPDQASAKIAEYMPTVVDHLSPNGTLPASGDMMSKASELLKSMLTKSA